MLQKSRYGFRTGSNKVDLPQFITFKYKIPNAFTLIFTKISDNS